MSLKERIISDMTAAMKAKDVARLSTLRMVKASVMNREIEKGGDLTDEELTKAMQSLVKQRRDSIEQYEKAGRKELAEKERAEIALIRSFLPAQMSEDELRAAAQAAIAQAAASSMRDMGRVMALLKERHAGAMDFGKASAVVKSLLTESPG